MIGTMTASQFVVYEQTRKQIKKMCGTPSYYLPETVDANTSTRRSKITAATEKGGERERERGGGGGGGGRGGGRGADLKKNKAVVPVAAPAAPQHKALFSFPTPLSRSAEKKIGKRGMEELDKEFGKRPRPKNSASSKVV